MTFRSTPLTSVFITGATGYVGSAIARRFMNAGYTVSGLARNEAAASRLAVAGVQPVMGNLGDPTSFAEKVRQAGIIVHAGFEYDAQGREQRDVDLRATLGMLDTASSTARAHDSPVPMFIYTSNAFLLRTDGGPPVDETHDSSGYDGAGSWRLDLERRVLHGQWGPVRTAVIRVGMVYSGLGGSLPTLFRAALDHHGGVYVGQGQSRVSLIHRDDLAALYLQVATEREEGIFHGVDGSPITYKSLAELISRAAGFNGRTVSVSRAEAIALLGDHMTEFMLRDIALLPVRSKRIGWQPQHPLVTADTLSETQVLSDQDRP